MIVLARSTGLLLKLPRAQSVLRPLVLSRAYALSRFPERGTGSSRQRPRVTLRAESARGPHGFDSPPQEDRPSSEESPLWDESQRGPFSDPEDGLKRLLLGHEELVVTRQIEMLNIFVGFEQTNRYVITNTDGETLGFIAEEPRGFFATFGRQIFRTHRPFRAVVMDAYGTPVLWVRRPFAWINSRMFVQRLQGEPVLDTFGEVQQLWHPWRRRYDLFLSLHTLAKIDEGFLAWYFFLRDARGQEIASIRRAFRGFGRELFTDTGQYFIRFSSLPSDAEDPTPRAPYVVRDLNLEERAVVFTSASLIPSCTVNVDFDYFSHHSSGSPGFGMWFFSAGED
ncbi:Scramblase-domain-containing protein [Fomitopsis serialis]|uniref:Scramblase-domain-containing protein n=1 Tax=Fomitopsis serialis TaxID=139415 RepID=UPI0020080607|nr:Scramblase-domain-containing protein [Neoantrodia serialis]KAH9934681.1 Scramblase-domain-containing protein [Neoantrodia serialis]